ncbi:MAG TPA: arginine--tRNA ligase [Candidatus Eisenbergiella merdavium]|uniref:Arginine--tRNA ligase n=1 Tax=Candidatus Eisenbergiella merdavium TaxID=2838551 RepID=A0A9D2NIN4_9FIRM|nr:arginine--tRNA ligase [Candidatus Eisenbergiella merdavium]
MDKILDVISGEVKKAFETAGYDGELGRVTLSNRPDLCEYQCNGSLAGAKKYHKAPLMIAQGVAEALQENPVFAEVSAVAPGFLNLKLSEDFLSGYLNEMAASEKFGVGEPEKKETIIIDYGGPNVAKPLHVGHLRPAIIGESVKRILRYAGHNVIGDVHLGDWGLQMGQVIMELEERQPELPYFDENYEGEYPKEPPFTVAEMGEMYAAASAKCKTDEACKARALENTRKFQNGVRGYRALWKHIMDVSLPDIKENYDRLNVEFDLWKGESDVQDLIPGMVEKMKQEGFAHESEGALVVDVKEETDTKEIPPCIILKSDGASLYSTTDLATLEERTQNYHPDSVIYITDKRQAMHFEQVFRCARKTGLVEPETRLVHIGFGTVNGKDGKPFKTREGGVPRLENLIEEIDDEMYRKIRESRRELSDEDARRTADIVGLAALKYGDLSNQAAKDYVFDVDRFTSFEGDTGPYILYTIVRIKSILEKYTQQGGSLSGLSILPARNPEEKALMLELSGFQAMVAGASKELAPNRVCAYIYDLSNAFNRFYHETKIIAEEDEARKAGLIALLMLTKGVLEDCIGLLGFSAPDRM